MQKAQAAKESRVDDAQRRSPFLTDCSLWPCPTLLVGAAFLLTRPSSRALPPAPFLPFSLSRLQWLLPPPLHLFSKVEPT